MRGADPQIVLAGLVQARSTSLLHTAYLLTGDQATAERLLEQALLSVRSQHDRVDPQEVEIEVRTAMVRIASRGGREARQRTVAALIRHEGLTSHELAHMLGRSLGSVARDLAQAESLRVEVPDDMAATAEWRADVTEELREPVRPTFDWASAGVVAIAVVIAACFALAVLHDDEKPLDRPGVLPLGNSRVIAQFPAGRDSRVDLLDSQGMLRTPRGEFVSVGTRRTVLGRSPGGWVVALDGGGFEVVRSDGSRVSIGTSAAASGAISPDGTRLITSEGTFDTLTGTRLAGPEPTLDADAVYVGWGANGAVAVARNGDAYLLADDGSVRALSAAPYAVARSSDRVLLPASDQCDAVYSLDVTGELSLERSWCTASLLALSPDGGLVLAGQDNGENASLQGSRAEALLDVETGQYTTFPSLNHLTQYGGSDLVDMTWEDGGTLLLAFLVDRPDPVAGQSSWDMTRVIRCVIEKVTCEATPGRQRPPRDAPYALFSESGAFASR